MKEKTTISVARTLGLVAVISAGAGTPARAVEPVERAETLILGAAVNRFVAKQLPVSFQLRGNRAAGVAPLDVTLLEASYCGALDAGRGRLVGLVRPGASAPATAPQLMMPRDCLDKLEDVAHRIPVGADGAAVVELVAEWSPWELRFVIGDSASSGPSATALSAALARTKAAGPLETLDTSAIHLATARGAALELDLALSFLKAGDGVLGTLTVAGHGRDVRPSFLEPAGAPLGADVIAGATFPFAQGIVALFGQDGPLVLELEGQAVEVRGLQLSGGNAQLAVRGRATSRALNESLRLVIEAAGADLKVTEVRAEPELEDCGAAALATLSCRARNAARTAAAAAFASGVTARYRGQPLRTLLPPPPFSFDLAGRHLTLRLAPSRVRATAAGPVIYGRGELE